MTENIKAKKDSTSVKINVQVMNPSKKIAILQMDANSAVPSRADFTPATLPKQITPKQAADYIVIETTRSGIDGKEKVTRKLFGKDAQALESFGYRDDGYCVKQSTQELWPDTVSQSVS